MPSLSMWAVKSASGLRALTDAGTCSKLARRSASGTTRPVFLARLSALALTVSQLADTWRIAMRYCGWSCRILEKTWVYQPESRSEPSTQTFLLACRAASVAISTQ